jgi:hypothetical protein
MAQYVREAEHLAGLLNASSKRSYCRPSLAHAGPGLGVVAMVDKRRIFFKEEWPGALGDAERTDQGLVGVTLRWMRDTGRFSQSEQVQDVIEYGVRRRVNSEIRKGLESVRGRKAVLEKEAAFKAAIDDWIAMLRGVEAGNEWIYQSLKDDPDCKDIAPHWPLKLLNGLPIPIVDPHITIDEVYLAPKRTRKPEAPKGEPEPDGVPEGVYVPKYGFWR